MNTAATRSPPGKLRSPGDRPIVYSVRTSSDAARESVALPASAYAETLVGPSRRGDADVRQVRAFVDRFRVRVVPLDGTIGEAATALRARTAHATAPNALVIPTAVVLNADVILTTGRRRPSRSALRLRLRISQLSPTGALVRPSCRSFAWSPLDGHQFYPCLGCRA